MANTADTLRKPQSGWGRANRVAQRSILAFTIVAAGASSLAAEPLEANGTRNSNPTPPIVVERTSAEISTGQGLTAPQMSVSAFSATRTSAARVLLAQEINGESNRAVGVTFPAASPTNDATRVGEAQARQQEAAEAREAETEESLIVGRSLRAFTRAEEEPDASAPRRRASFSSAISRAAAAGALTSSTSPNSTVSNSLSPSRFAPASNIGQFDPGFSKAADVLSVVPGLRLESATIFGGYSSNVAPRSFGASFINRSQNLGADYDLGASAVISYGHQGRRSLTTLTYAPSHVQRSRIPEWSTTDHRLSFQSTRDLTPRLSLRANANAGNSGLEQFWTRPAVTRRVEAPPSFGELMNKVLAGEISNDEFASILTGSPVVDDPGGAGQGLNRILSASAGASGSYAYSRRMTINFGANSSLIRQLTAADVPTQGPNYQTFARITGATASANYRLSSRTRVSLNHVTSFSESSLTKSVAHSPNVGFNQALSRRWSYGISAGIGTISFDRAPDYNGTDLSDATTWTAGANLAYGTRSHQLTLSAGKQVGDPLGLGSRTTTQASLMYNWQPRFSPWGATGGVAFSRSQFAFGSAYGQEFMSDLYNAGLSRRLTASTTFRSDYYYGEYASPYQGIVSDMAVHRLQMSLVWRPVEPR